MSLSYTRTQKLSCTHAIRNSGFSVRAIIRLTSFLQNAKVVRLYRTNKQNKQKRDAETNDVTNQPGSAIACCVQNSPWWRHLLKRAFAELRKKYENKQFNIQEYKYLFYDFPLFYEDKYTEA